jgi:hypothetical protein
MQIRPLQKNSALYLRGFYQFRCEVLQSPGGRPIENPSKGWVFAWKQSCMTCAITSSPSRRPGGCGNCINGPIA